MKKIIAYTDDDKPYGDNPEDYLDYELRVIDRRVRIENKERKDKATTTIEGAVQAAQRYMFSSPKEFPMTDTLFIAECKRRKVGNCSICKLRFRCWTE